jgi:probable blue pigment (indigoidine) exporter
MPTPGSGRHSSFALVAAAASWGLATVMSKRAVVEIEPLLLLVVQLGSSVLLTGAFLAQRGRLVASRTWGKDALLGLLNPGVSYLLGLAGLASISASMSVLLWATEPLMIVGLAWVLLGERNRGVLGSVTVAAVGVALIGVFPDSTGTTAGVLLTVAGVAACATYTVISRKLGLSDATAVVVLTQQVSALAFALALFGVLLVFRRIEFPADVSGQAWLAAVTSGVIYYAVAFFFYLTGLRETPAATAGLYLNLIPVFGIAAGFTFLNERLSGRQWIGALLIIGAVVIVARVHAAGSARESTRSPVAGDG